MKETYQTAVLELIRSGQSIETIAAGLTRVLKARGHERLAAGIWQAVVRVLEAGKASGSTVYVVSQADYDALKGDITAVLTQLAAPTEPTVVLDQTLIGGFVAEGNSQRIDTSYKKQLVDLYRNVTT